MFALKMSLRKIREANLNREDPYFEDCMACMVEVFKAIQVEKRNILILAKY